MFRHMTFTPGFSGRKRRWEAILNHVGLPNRTASDFSGKVAILMFDATNSSETDPAMGGRMRTNRSMPSSTVIPVLLYRDVVQAVEWLCGTFGFTEHLRIGSHRSQLTVVDGTVVVAAGPPGSGIDCKKTGAG